MRSFLIILAAIGIIGASHATITATSDTKLPTTNQRTTGRDMGVQALQGGEDNTSLQVQPAQAIELQYPPNAVTLQDDPLTGTLQESKNNVQ